MAKQQHYAEEVPSGMRTAKRPATKIKHPGVPRSPSQGRTSAKGYGAAPVGPLGREIPGIRSQSNGSKRYKGG